MCDQVVLSHGGEADVCRTFLRSLSVLQTSSKTLGGFLEHHGGGWWKMAAFPLPVTIWDDLIFRFLWGHFPWKWPHPIWRNWKWGHPRWWTKAERPPFSTIHHHGVPKTHPILLLLMNKTNLKDLVAATGLVISLKLDSNHRFFSLCDLEISWMTSKNNRAPLIYYIKLCASSQTHW